MKLAVSNIAWQDGDEPQVLDLLGRLGVAGIEVAPTRIWPDWAGATPAAAAALGNRLAERGFQVPALQAILYARPELKVFGQAAERRALIDHIGFVAELGQALGARVLVFGSPRNRDKGALQPEEAIERAVEVFRRAAERCQPFGVALCLEPNPEVYHCTFMTHWHEAAEVVARVDHPALGLHLDAACMALAGDDPAAAVRASQGRFRHFHVTEPNLGQFAAPEIDHPAIGRALRAVGYEGWRSIEMRRADDPIAAIARAVQVARDAYGPDDPR